MNSSFTPDVLTPPDQNEEQFPPNFGHSKLTSRNEQLERVLDDGHVGDGEKDLRVSVCDWGHALAERISKEDRL